MRGVKAGQSGGVEGWGAMVALVDESCLPFFLGGMMQRYLVCMVGLGEETMGDFGALPSRAQGLGGRRRKLPLPDAVHHRLNRTTAQTLSRHCPLLPLDRTWTATARPGGSCLCCCGAPSCAKLGGGANKLQTASTTATPATLPRTAPATALAADHGGGSMLVVSPGSPLQKDASAHHAPSARLVSPAPAQQIADMEVATAADAPAPVTAMPALAALDLPDAPAHDDLSLPAAPMGNGLPLALDAAISLPQPAALDAMDLAAMSAFPEPAASDERVNAFARLRFDDGSYYMHTYQIVLGRNIALAHRDMRRLAKVDQLHADGQPQAAQELLNGHNSKKRRRDRHGARSVISEKGGIVNAPIESMPIEYQQRRQSNASHSLSSASHPTGDSVEEKPAERAPQDMIMQAFPELPAQFDGHIPEDPNDCPLVPIHPHHITARNGAQGPKGISRHHAKIFYDFDNGNFCVEVLGSNGLHHENQFIRQGQIVPLDHGDRLLIGAVNIQFYLPDIALTEDQRHRQESGSRPMSFSFENGHGELESDDQMSSESEGELSINPRHVYHYPVDSDVVSDDAIGDDDDDDDLYDYDEPAPRPPQKQSLKLKIKAP